MFVYTVQPGDDSGDYGVFLQGGSASLKLDSDDAIRATSSEWDASLFFRVQGTQRGHKVDGGQVPPPAPCPARRT